jgi:hypothetical protein
MFRRVSLVDNEFWPLGSPGVFSLVWMPSVLGITPDLRVSGNVIH